MAFLKPSQRISVIKAWPGQEFGANSLAEFLRKRQKMTGHVWGQLIQATGHEIAIFKAHLDAGSMETRQGAHKRTSRGYV
jgi:hypothetical protein